METIADKYTVECTPDGGYYAYLCNHEQCFAYGTDYDAAAYSVAVNAEGTTMGDAKKLFGGKPVIGGFTQDGVIYTGTREEVKKATWDILDNAGQLGVIIGADCTVPNDIDDDRFNWVRDAAAEYAAQH